MIQREWLEKALNEIKTIPKTKKILKLSYDVGSNLLSLEKHKGQRNLEMWDFKKMIEWAEILSKSLKELEKEIEIVKKSEIQ